MSTTTIPTQKTPAHLEYLEHTNPSPFSLDGKTTIELHVRMEPPAQQRKSDGTFGIKPKPGSELRWYESEAHPKGWSPRGGQVDLQADGTAVMPEGFDQYFDDHKGVVMPKVVFEEKQGYVALPAFFKKPAWHVDPDENPRTYGPTAGKTGYSYPLHHFNWKKAGKSGAFFYVITLEGEDLERAVIMVYQVVILREDNRFIVSKNLHYYGGDNGGPVEVRLRVIEDMSSRVEQLDDLGIAIAEAVTKYRESFR